MVFLFGDFMDSQPDGSNVQPDESVFAQDEIAEKKIS